MYHGLQSRIDPDLFKQFQIICSRVRKFDGRVPVLWLHDTASDPEAQHLSNPYDRQRFRKLVFVSEYQFNTFRMKHGVSFAESAILRNAIEPIEKHAKPDPNERINLIYHTTPHRGLELLVPTFIALQKRYPNIYLDVYSSFSIYGWDQRDSDFEQIFKMCDEHPNITNHGVVPNEQIREALTRAHIFAYPCIWEETSAISVIEAMAAGCAVVAPNYGALSETMSLYGFKYHWSEHPQQHVNRFASTLNAVLSNYSKDMIQTNLKNQADYTNTAYGWKNRAVEWTNLLEGILNDGETS